MDIKALASDLQGPFLQAFKGDITLDKATEVASYNMMMSVLMDFMRGAALRSSVAHFLFTGFTGSIFTWALTYLVKFIATSGVNLALNLSHQWHMETLRKSYESNMLIYYQEIDLKEVLTREDINNYKEKVQSELKKFFNLSRFLK